MTVFTCHKDFQDIVYKVTKVYITMFIQSHYLHGDNTF
jgi:hypothetical protein